MLALLNARGLHAQQEHKSPALDLHALVHHVPWGLNAFAKGIKTLLGTYEPRIERVHVRATCPQTKPLIQVQVCAWHSAPPHRPLRLDFELRPDGRFSSIS